MFYFWLVLFLRYSGAKVSFVLYNRMEPSFNILFSLGILWMHGWLNKWFIRHIFLLFQIRPWSSKQRRRVFYSILFFGKLKFFDISKGRLALRILIKKIVLFRKHKSFSITASFMKFPSKIEYYDFFTIFKWKDLNLVTLQSKKQQ